MAETSLPMEYAYLHSLLAKIEQPRYQDNQALQQKAEKRLSDFFKLLESQAKPSEILGSEREVFTEASLLQALCDELNHLKNSQDDTDQNDLDELLFAQERTVLADGDDSVPAKQDGRGEQLELQSMKNFRESMKYFKLDQIIERALNDCPTNPGPHNPQMLAIKSLRLMQQLSPQYLRRFAGYIEMMMWLEKNASRLAEKKA